MFMKNAFMLFMSLGVGYAMCVLAKKEQGLLKTLGYTLGTSILVLSLLYSVFANEVQFGKLGGLCNFDLMSKACPMMKHKAHLKP